MDLSHRDEPRAGRAQASAALPQMQRIVARLYLVEDFEHPEIAAMIGITEGTVRSHLSLARRKLKDRLADLYERLRGDARTLRYEPDDVSASRVAARVRSRIAAAPTVAQLLARWARPLA